VSATQTKQLGVFGRAVERAAELAIRELGDDTETIAEYGVQVTSREDPRWAKFTVKGNRLGIQAFLLALRGEE
jgi:hypothetical protein